MMGTWLKEAFRETTRTIRHLFARRTSGGLSSLQERWILAVGIGCAVIALVAGIIQTGLLDTALSIDHNRIPVSETAVDFEMQTLLMPVRDEPRRFHTNTYRPPKPERHVNRSPNPDHFFPEHDLVRIDDPRVWWESDHDDATGDTEDDHVIHRAMEIPLRRLIELVDQADGTLKVQDTYRPVGIHNARSLHKEGRAVDVTCDELGLEKLSKLAWAAGFGWVYHEVPRNGGSHVHASVPADNPHLSPRQRAWVEEQIAERIAGLEDAKPIRSTPRG